MSAKKILSVILTVCLLVSAMTVSACAQVLMPTETEENGRAADGGAEAAEDNGENEENDGVLRVTKSPSGESVETGGDALFISSAENYSRVEWRIVSADGNECWRGEQEIEAQFKPVIFTVFQDDDGRECLYLDDIPVSMNGFYVQTKFWSLDETETVFTENYSCPVTVNDSTLKLPVVNINPQGVELESGKTTVLSVSASSPDGNRLKFQWYKNNVNSTVGAEKIPGATGTDYVPEELEGTFYYYCAIVNTDGSGVSAEELSKMAAVRYLPKAEEVSIPELAEQPADELRGPDEGQRIAPDKIVKLLAVIAVLMLALVAAVVYLILKRGDEDEDEQSGGLPGWYCEKCGKFNRGRLCLSCGAPKPAGELQYVCDKCGWEPEDPENPPRYCPICGEAFDDNGLRI